MDWGLIVAIVFGTVNLIVLVLTAVWGLSRLSTILQVAIAKLEVNFKNLEKASAETVEEVKAIVKVVGHHETRLTVVEGQVDDMS